MKKKQIPWDMQMNNKNNYDIVALELLCSISSFAYFEKRGVKVVSLYFASFYVCISTAGFKVHRIPFFSQFYVMIDLFLWWPIIWLT